MSFQAYLIYLVLIFLRPIDLFAPDLADFRPVLIVWVVAFVSAVSEAIGRREIACRPASIWMLLGLVLVIPVSKIANGWFGGAVIAVANFSTSAMLFLLSVLNLRSIERIRTTAKVITWSMVILAMLSIGAYHTGYLADELLFRQNSPPSWVADPSLLPSFPKEDLDNYYFWRVRGMGFLNDPNDFGQLMVMVLPFLWAGTKIWQSMRNVAVMVPMAILGYGIYLTQSRGAMLGAVLVGVAALYRAVGAARLGIVLVPLLGGVGSLVVGGRGFTTQEASADERIGAWWAGIQMLKEHPLFGVGYDSFFDHHYLTAHNSFVLCFAELGIVGYFFWIGMLVLGYKGVSQVLDTVPVDSDRYNLAYSIRLSLLGYVACAWFLSRAYSPSLYFLLGLCSGIAWCTLRKPAEAGGSPSMVAYGRWGMATASTMLLSYLVVQGFVIARQMGI